MGFPRERQMLLPKCGAPSEIVINQCVLEQVVTHVESVYGRCMRSSRGLRHAREQGAASYLSASTIHPSQPVDLRQTEYDNVADFHGQSSDALEGARVSVSKVPK